MIETQREPAGLAVYDTEADTGDWSDSPTMDQQASHTNPMGAEAEVPPRWALERAELQSEVDALVHQALSGLLKSAEDLKQRIREETNEELRKSRLERDALYQEIEAARQELGNVQSGQSAAAQEALEQEREGILAQARAEAEQIIQNAQAEREQMLAEIRATETRLRGLQEQIQSLLGFGGGAAAASTTPAPVAPAPVAPPPPPVAPQPPMAVASEPAPAPTPVYEAPEPEPVHLEATRPTALVETPIVPDAPAPPTNFSGLIDSTPEPETPAIVPVPATPPPASSPAPAAPVAAAPAPAPVSAGPRTMQLIFTNVPGYQQAAAIERATRQLPDVSGVDVQEFERGRLVLEIQAGNPAALADQMVSSAPAVMSVAEQAGDSITFQLA